MLLTDAPIDLPSDIGLWRSSFVPLAVHRTIPLWRVANLPTAICDRPDSLIGIARAFIERLDSIYPDLRLKHTVERGWIDDAFVERASAILEATVRDIAEAYGPGTAGELLLWLGRNEANWAAHNRWWGWWLLLDGVARGRRTLPDTLVDPAAQVHLVAQLMLEPTIEKALDGAEAEALLIPLDSLEERIVRIDIGTAGTDDEDSSQDVVTQMVLASLRERACLGYQLLSMALTAADLETLERLAAKELGRA